MIMNKFSIIIPLGGLGKRFSEAGYQYPKPLVKVYGKCIINWLLDSLLENIEEINEYSDNKITIQNIFIPYHRSLDNFRFKDKLKKDYPKMNFNFYKLDMDTKGAADTVYQTLNKYIETIVSNHKTNVISESDNIFNNYETPIICLDGDNFYTTNILKQWVDNKFNTGLFLFEDNEPYEVYSYVKLAEYQINNINHIVEIKEKEKISNLACTGAYCFNNMIELISYCEKILGHHSDCNNSNKSNNSNNSKIETHSGKYMQKGEYYISSIYKCMLELGTLVRPYIINKGDYKCLGTPTQVKLFTENNKHLMPKKRFCFDLDNTLVTYPPCINGIKLYQQVKPITKNIELLRKLKNEGHYIIIYTARRMVTHNSNIGKINAEQGKIIFDTLEKFNIPFDEIYFGKPYADYYIDDSAINAFSNLEKELGFYNTKVECRSFNSIKYTSNKVRKTSLESNLNGEISYYKTIKKLEDLNLHHFKYEEQTNYKNVINLFPKLLDYDHNDNTWYELERVNGIPVGKLYLDKELSKDELLSMLDTFKMLHSTILPDEIYNLTTDELKLFFIKALDKAVYNNYYNKVESRLIKYKGLYDDLIHNKGTNNNINNNTDNNSGLRVIINNNLNLLKQYENDNSAKIGMIHGDAVFTNILIDENKNIKLIDMRGKLGENNNCLCVYGDTLYDYAKMYQSLIGYDEIIENVVLDESYKIEMIQTFETYILENFDINTLNNIKIITRSLLISLIPLHHIENDEKSNKKIDKFIELIMNNKYYIVQ
jgi:capsule biosynthesis phosphatase